MLVVSSLTLTVSNMAGSLPSPGPTTKECRRGSHEAMAALELATSPELATHKTQCSRGETRHTHVLTAEDGLSGQDCRT